MIKAEQKSDINYSNIFHQDHFKDFLECTVSNGGGAGRTQSISKTHIVDTFATHMTDAPTVTVSITNFVTKFVENCSLNRGKDKEA